jgi:nanoRNase/pAp phosphatase (c-di-AMP/oligoRNAs hydrolase)
MVKRKIHRISEKNRVIENIVKAMTSRHHFLLLGHTSPDDDCIGALISFALLLHMFYKDVVIYLGGQTHERFRYLLEICKYNSIRIIGPGMPAPPKIDTIVLCDTPKPSMIEINPENAHLLRDPDVLKIEIDHHIGADSEYFGDEGVRLVTEASSASELIGHILMKLRLRKDLLESYQITELFPRNMVLAILTGIIGDSNMGQYLKSPREKKYYQIFSSLFNDLLTKRTVKASNFFTMEQVHMELQKLSANEEGCFQYMMDRKRFSPSIGYVSLSESSTSELYANFNEDTIVSTARSVADSLAEESSFLGMVAYYDNPERSDLIQFRIRRSGNYKKFDLRQLLALFSISNGGGHEGAIGFRVPRKDVSDYDAYVEKLVAGIEEALQK